MPGGKLKAPACAKCQDTPAGVAERCGKFRMDVWHRNLRGVHRGRNYPPRLSSCQRHPTTAGPSPIRENNRAQLWPAHWPSPPQSVLRRQLMLGLHMSEPPTAAVSIGARGGGAVVQTTARPRTLPPGAKERRA
eukprot:gene9881-biopygen15285